MTVAELIKGLQNVENQEAVVHFEGHTEYDYAPEIINVYVFSSFLIFLEGSN